MFETEYQFIVAIDGEPGDKENAARIEQHYLVWKGRMRRSTSLATGEIEIAFNRKWRLTGIGRNLELDFKVPNFMGLSRLCYWVASRFFLDDTCSVVRKTRAPLDLHVRGLVAEVDLFEDLKALEAWQGQAGEGAHLCRLEVEIPDGFRDDPDFSEEAVRKLLPPNVRVLVNVTGDPSQSNVAIARRLKNRS